MCWCAPTTQRFTPPVQAGTPDSWVVPGQTARVRRDEVSLQSVPPWDLAVVLEALCRPPFEPIEEISDCHLTLKVTLLLAISSLKGVGDLQALSVAPTHLDFAPGMAKAFLYLEQGMFRRSPPRHHGQSYCRPSVLLPFGILTSKSITVCVQCEHWTHTSTELPCGERRTNC